ncbi:MAG: Xaa-Pro dipeptidase [Pseudomonadota bacterium]
MMTEQLYGTLYKSHLETLMQRASTTLSRENLDGLIIHSGQLSYQFLDDIAYPFKVNPHFKAWLPILDNPNSWLVINGTSKPKLIFYLPVDFWHKVPEKPTEAWVEHFDINYLAKADKVEKLLPYDRENYAYIGEHIEVAQALGFKHINPEGVLHYFHYHRAYKTDYELACMRQANQAAIRAHKAASTAFYEKKSELDIHHAYIDAVNMNQELLPYNNIVALNKNASILHYMVQQDVAPDVYLSFLIDAGATFNGYASDITRTYTTSDGLFAQLISHIDSLTQRLSAAMSPGLSYAEVHEQAHVGIANILHDAGIVNLLPENMLEVGITKTFFPHGIGHYLGLQVHDVGAHLANDNGLPLPPIEGYPFLRCSRNIEASQVFTIEPGLYFIDSLLAELKSSNESKFINWNVIDELIPYGGIRIEDNVIVHADSVENMTRNYWALDNASEER